MLTTLQKVLVFYSYSHHDEYLRKELETHLALLRRQGLIEEWHDRKISAGTEWKNSIDKHLETADIILLLVSANFLASDYCYDIEMRRALARHDADQARVIPIILSSVDWQGAPFSKLQALPTDAKPVTGRDWHNHDEAWADVAKGIRQVIDELRGAPPANHRSAEDADDSTLLTEQKVGTSKQETSQCGIPHRNNREDFSKSITSAILQSAPVSVVPRKSSLKDVLVEISLQTLDPLSSSQNVPGLAVQLRNTGDTPLFISQMGLQITVDDSYQEEEKLANLPHDRLLQEINPSMHSALKPQERRIFTYRLSTLIEILQGKGASITVNALKIRDEHGEISSFQLPLPIRTALEVRKQPNNISKAMEWHKVESSNLDKVRYDATNHTLEICFKSGSAYQYHDVPERIFHQLLASSSKGSFLHTTIKRYPYKKVR